MREWKISTGPVVVRMAIFNVNVNVNVNSRFRVPMFLLEAAPHADGATDEDRALLDGTGLDALMIDAVGSIFHDAVQDGDNEMADFLLEACSDRVTNAASLCLEAAKRWLTTAEVFNLLQTPARYGLVERTEAPRLPGSGALFLFRKQTGHKNSFRKDGHGWKMKKNGKQAAESHEKLSVEGVERVKCYYAHTQDGLLARRIYSLIEGDEDLQFIQYLATSLTLPKRKDKGGAAAAATAPSAAPTAVHSSGGHAGRLGPSAAPASAASASAASASSSSSSAAAAAAAAASSSSSAAAAAAATSAAAAAAARTSTSQRPDLRLVEMCPAWDYVCGGARVLVAALTLHGCRYGACFGSSSAAPAEVGAR